MARRICYLAEASSAHTQRWATYFAGRGWEVRVLSFRPAIIPGVVVHTIGLPALGRLGYLWAAAQARGLIQRLGPDLLHAHYATSYGLVGALSGFHPFVLSSWGSDIFAAAANSWLLRALVRFNFRRADYLCATSHALAAEVKKYAPPGVAVHITPFGVDGSFFRPGPPKAEDQTVTVGTVRALERIYGLEYLVTAFAVVRQRYPQARLVLVGDGSQRRALAQQAERLGLGEAVEFRGRVPLAELVAELQAMDIFVAPSVCQEAFGVSLLEAAACGLPVVATRVGGFPEVVVDGETGYLVPPGDAAALADRIAALAANAPLRRAMGQAGRRFALENYEWSENASRMERLYHSILG